MHSKLCVVDGSRGILGAAIFVDISFLKDHTELNVASHSPSHALRVLRALAHHQTGVDSNGGGCGGGGGGGRGRGSADLGRGNGCGGGGNGSLCDGDGGGGGGGGDGGHSGVEGSGPVRVGTEHHEDVALEARRTRAGAKAPMHKLRAVIADGVPKLERATVQVVKG